MRLEFQGWRMRGVTFRNARMASGGKAGVTAAQVTGAVGGTFLGSDGLQFNLNAPGSGRLEGQQFIVRAAGWIKLPAGTYTATVVVNLYGVQGSAAWTAAAGNKLAASTSISYTQAGTTVLNVPYLIEVQCEGDSTSGQLQGLMKDIVGNVKDATNNWAILTNAPTGVNFNVGGAGASAASGQTTTEPCLQFAAGVTLTNAQTGAICNLTDLGLFTGD